MIAMSTSQETITQQLYINNTDHNKSDASINMSALVQETGSSYSIVDIVLLQVCEWTCMLVVLAGFCLIAYITLTRQSFQAPNFYFMLSYMAGDLLQFLGTAVPACITILTDATIPAWHCATIGQLPLFGLFSGVHMTGFIALERWAYLCRPFLYSRIFTNTKTILMITAIWIFGLVYSIVVYALDPRVYYDSIFSCQTKLSPLVMLLHWTFIILPSLILTGFSACKVFSLRNRIGVTPAISTIQNPPANQQSNIPAIRQALRLIFLTSGLLWIVTIPAYTIMTFVHRSGVTMKDVEEGRDFPAARLLRLSNAALYWWSPSFNIFLHLFIHKDLRLEVKNIIFSMILRCKNSIV